MKTSWVVMMSPSMPTISVMAVMRRVPSLKSRLLDDQVDCAGHLLADGAHRQVHARHQDHGLQTGQGVARGVGVQGRDRAVVAGVHGLEHVERRGVTDLADDDAVGAHAQGVLHQVTDGDGALALDVGGPRLEPAARGPDPASARRHPRW